MWPRNAVWAFALRVFTWLVPCFAAWYLIAPWHARLVAPLAKLLVNMLTFGIVEKVEPADRVLTFVTSIEVRQPGGVVGLASLDLNPLIYTFGAALFVALMLGSRARWRPIILGLVLLLPFQAWGLAFDLMAEVGMKMGAMAASQAGIVGWRREFTALGYQVGSLILPTLAPVLLWALMQRSFIESLANPAR